ncbi:hypothetical protein ART_3709 [Arthrobacter sp. PAMC 25486]|uniref:maleylpyruvate isomerase family mycothiol-dependent enzyme n=1 Tax=Arthrobacter sp. PAMC 25486 TaxID=1494608 RepID=UPI000535F8FA|nr:maleylpyruvate isomerase family mycothiol-dependent enzyme [Arthrobacter sp. PAMC 25486]AIY03308.1 hypothetical protein ART_3709 [Arthrobacter sp. PAMC 25486]
MNSTVNATTIAPTDKGAAGDAYPSVMNAVATSFEALTPAQWETGTECTGWTVRDLAAHLLGAQEDALSVPTVLWRRLRGRRRYPHLSLLDAANQVQVDDHAALEPAELCRTYRENIPGVAKRVRTFPGALAGIAVDKTMAPGNAPLRLGYLFNVIYLRDAWMHGIDLARAAGFPRVATDADATVLEQILRDAATAWGAGAAVELVLSGELAGTWQLGDGEPQGQLGADGIELCRSLSGRLPESGISTASGNPVLAARLAELRIVF